MAKGGREGKGQVSGIGPRAGSCRDNRARTGHRAPIHDGKTDPIYRLKGCNQVCPNVVLDAQNQVCGRQKIGMYDSWPCLRRKTGWDGIKRVVPAGCGYCPGHNWGGQAGEALIIDCVAVGRIAPTRLTGQGIPCATTRDAVACLAIANNDILYWVRRKFGNDLPMHLHTVAAAKRYGVPPDQWQVCGAASKHGSLKG